MNVDIERFEKGKVSSFYSVILMVFYKINMLLQYPLIRRIVDNETGLERFFKMNLDNRFVEVKLNGILPLLTKDQITFLSENILSFELWQDLIPPDRFEFEGFLVVNMFEVTEQEALSALKQDLLKKDVFKTETGFAAIEKISEPCSAIQEFSWEWFPFQMKREGLLMPVIKLVTAS
jgi:hypothetical protein